MQLCTRGIHDLARKLRGSASAMMYQGADERLHAYDRSFAMGDKGKKDKAKDQKQKTVKHDDDTRKKLEKQPKKAV